MVITGIGDNVPDCVSDPLTTGIDVDPKPLAYITIVSPGWAGVVKPGYRLVGPR